MSQFHIIEDAYVILRSKGTFYQKKVYRRTDRFYANWGSGFIRLGARDATSNPNVSLEHLSLPENIIVGKDAVSNPLFMGVAGDVVPLGKAA